MFVNRASLVWPPTHLPRGAGREAFSQGGSREIPENRPGGPEGAKTPPGGPKPPHIIKGFKLPQPCQFVLFLFFCA